MKKNRNSTKNVLTGDARWAVEAGDAIERMQKLPDDSIDLVLASPPYCDARTYGTEDVARDCIEWVGWMLEVSEEAARVCSGLVLWVVAGVQRGGIYQPGPEGLVWEWYKRCNHLWRPVVWWKVDKDEGGSGLPGTGGKQWLRADWEYVLAFKNPGKLPWADPLVMGEPPVCAEVGGAMRNRNKGGDRTEGGQPMPAVANPGNVQPIVVKARVGGGHMGSPLAHLCEAPYPEELATFFIRSFCKPGGIVLDPFSGSGTTVAMAVRHGRRGIGYDLRDSQVSLAKRRISSETPDLFGGE